MSVFNTSRSRLWSMSGFKRTSSNPDMDIVPMKSKHKLDNEQLGHLQQATPHSANIWSSPRNESVGSLSGGQNIVIRTDATVKRPF